MSLVYDPVATVLDAFDDFKGASEQKWNVMQDQLDSIEKVNNRQSLGGGAGRHRKA
jgi:hypothetical protein